MSQARVPAWISVGVLPAVNILLAFLVSAILFYYLDISPIEAAEIMCTAPSAPARDRLHPLPPPVSSSPVWRWRWPSTPACSTSAVRAGLYRRPRGRSGLSAARGRAAVRPAAAARHHRRRPVRCGLGLHPAWLQAKRGSHIVITTIIIPTSSRPPDGLPAGRRLQAARIHGHREQGVRRGELAAEDEQAGGRFQASPCQQPLNIPASSGR